MITALDTSILIDVFSADPEFGPRSREALRRCLSQGALVACAVVWAEVAALFASTKSATDAWERLGVRFTPIEAPSAEHAGVLWRRYRERGGQRQRVIADFLIGAHALRQADRLLTRDRGFYRTYFEDLMVVDSSR